MQPSRRRPRQSTDLCVDEENRNSEAHGTKAGAGWITCSRSWMVQTFDPPNGDE